MKTETDAALIENGIAPFVGSVFDCVDRVFPGDGNAEVRHAIVELFVRTAFERITHAQRLELIGAMSSRWKTGVN